ncbi:hypothetical protein HHI36_012366 [Cryptolaemus montrouzieri]|uniref:Uncharacterized protein n=1 Tax=Cryptolaemus montrouzieri TaxID=559131 RepID=A0ABD2NEH5_9CUCU
MRLVNAVDGLFKYVITYVDCGCVFKSTNSPKESVPSRTGGNQEVYDVNLCLVYSMRSIGVCQESMDTAKEEAVAQNSGDRDIVAASEGSWQKQSHTSLTGTADAFKRWETYIATTALRIIVAVVEECKQRASEPYTNAQNIVMYSTLGATGIQKPTNELQIHSRMALLRKFKNWNALGLCKKEWELGCIH